MTESFTHKVIHAFVFLAICFAIISAAWKQPLSYWFMSPVEITQLESPSTPAPVATPSAAWMNDPNRKTPLDDRTPTQGRSNQSGGGLFKR